MQVLQNPTEQIRIIACGALAREILAVIELNGWQHFSVICLPAKLHNTPQKIPEALRNSLEESQNLGFQKIFVAYADCGTAGEIDKVCTEFQVERIAGPHCYAFFDGLDAFAARADEEFQAFYLTDFLARQFDTLIWKGLRLDHDDIRQMMFGNYRKLIYLAQTEDPALEKIAQEAAARLELTYEKRMTGYGELAMFIQNAANAVSPV